MDTIKALGRRKSSVARIYMMSGKGNIIINNKKFEDYFPLKQHQNVASEALKVTEKLGDYDVKITVRGGGLKGQSEAIRLGIARALVKADPENHAALKPAGLLTRDPRIVERKKPGLRKARKQTQFSKR